MKTGHSFGRTDTSKKDAPKCSFQKTIINRPFVSGTHFTISRSDDSFFLRDSSSNGTYLNGSQIKKDVEVPLFDGDVISLRFKEEDQLVLTFNRFDGDNAPGNLKFEQPIEHSFSEQQSFGESSDALTFKPQISALKEENKLLEDRLAASMNSNDAMRKEISNLQREILTLKSSIEDKNSKIADIEAAHKDLQAKSSSAEARCVNLEDGMAEAREQIRNLKSTLNSLQAKTTDNSGLEGTKQRIQDELELRNKQLETRSEAIDDLSLQVTKEKAMTKRLKQDLANMKSQNIESRQQHELLLVANTSLEARLQSNFELIAQLEDNIKRRSAIEETYMTREKTFHTFFTDSLQALASKLTEFSSDQPDHTDVNSHYKQIEQLISLSQAINVQTSNPLEALRHRQISYDHIDADTDGAKEDEQGEDQFEREDQFTQVATGAEIAQASSAPFYDRTPMEEEKIELDGDETCLQNDNENENKGPNLQFHFSSSPAVSQSPSQSQDKKRARDEDDDTYEMLF